MLALRPLQLFFNRKERKEQFRLFRLPPKSNLSSFRCAPFRLLLTKAGMKRSGMTEKGTLFFGESLTVHKPLQDAFSFF